MEPFAKRECSQCQHLDQKLRAFLSSLPKDVQEEPVKDPTPYMCDIHARLYHARIGGKLIPMPIDLVMPKMVWASGNAGAADEEPEFPALDGLPVQVRLKDGAHGLFEISLAGDSFEASTDVGLVEGTYIFHEPWIMTEAFWKQEMKHPVPPEAQAVMARYHAVPITYDDDLEAGKVQVYCEPPHLTREGKPCNARVTDAEEHHVICPQCGVEVKLWEYAVGPTVDHPSGAHSH